MAKTNSKNNDKIIANNTDDGWDTDEIWNETDASSTPTVKPISFQLPQQLNVKSQKVIVHSRNDEDDLFIPIFTLVSISGFVGAYGYEMIRLYLRGELYLPFLH